MMQITPRKAAILAALVNFIGGYLFGVGTGYVPVAIQYYAYETNCSRYEAESACAAITGCVFEPAAGCLFSDRQLCNAPQWLTNKSHCNGLSDSCFWDSDSGTCQHTTGWTALQQGVLASMMIIGATVSSPIANVLLTRIGRTKSLLLSGTIAVAGSVLQGIAWQQEIFGLFVASRFIIGFSVGIAAVVSPLYCGEVAPKRFRNALGCVFQLSITAGIVCAAILGVIISPVDATVDDEHLLGKFQLLNVYSGFSAVLVVLVGVFAPEPTEEFIASIAAQDVEADGLITPEARTAAEEEQTDDAGINVDAKAQTPGSSSSLVMPIVIGTAMAAVLQFTGMNAIMNYAPHMTARAGMAPLTGNLLIMVWNFLAAILSVPVAKRCRPRTMYIVATGVATVACLIAGVPTYPGLVEDQAARHACVWIGILLYVATYEIGIGPPFYSLGAAVFPSTHRSFGQSFCVMFNFLFNVFVNFGFPIAVEALSGGSSGNQNKGQAVVFIIFGGVGVVFGLFLMKFLYPATN
jgi:sugar porter (SP) family MFS transporter